jgi:polar amino acid transport system substrate-binding protein
MANTEAPRKSGAGNRVLATLGIIVLVVAIHLIMNTYMEPEATTTTTAVESVYSRVIESGVIRCGYVSNPPSCVVDPNTGKVTGIFAEAIEKAASNLGLRIEWTEEVGFGSMIEGLVTDRYDLVPAAIWPTASRARLVEFSTPLFYSGVGAYVRAKDTRFDDNLVGLNSESVKIATMDGEMAELIAQNDFPKAERIQVPQLSDITMMLLNVKGGKADVSFVELYFAHEFLKNNPGSIRNITPDNPIRVFPNTALVKRGEVEFKAMINVALDELINQGVVDRLLDKYEPAPGTFYRKGLPYRVAN